MALNVRKIHVDDARANMVLARNVVADSGLILMSENTMLNDRSIMKLKVYDIENIYIKEFGADAGTYPGTESVTQIADQRDLPVEQTPQFQLFSAEYEANEQVAKSALLSISDGGDADIGELFSISSAIMDALRFKSDLFTYLHHLRSKNEHTFTHSVNVSLLCNLFGYWLGFKPDEIINITIAGILHDIGNTMIDDTILNKPGKLTKQEYDEIKKHPIYGSRMLKNQDLPNEVKNAVLMHHERLDGSGYPSKLVDKQISNYAKIVAIADMYDAMTSNRSYRGKICPFEVIKIFEHYCYGQLDTEFLIVFLQNIAYTYVGSRVMLSTGQEAEVVFINSGSLSSPLVRLGNKFLDLSTNTDITITYLL